MRRRLTPDDVPDTPPPPDAALRLLVDDVDAGGFVVDHHCVIRFANRALAGLHAVDDPATIVDRDFLDMVAPVDVGRIEPGSEEPLDRVAAPSPVAMQVLRRDGSTADDSLEHFNGTSRHEAGDAVSARCRRAASGRRHRVDWCGLAAR